MWIVRLALRRPYTFVVAAMLVAVLGFYMIFFRVPTDIFPSIDIPVVSVIFNYTGMSATDMERRIVTPFEGFIATTVNDIQRTESQSLNGVSVIKIYFQPNAQISTAIAQVTSISQTAIRNMPPGTQPPLVIQYSASDVPILQLSIGSDTLSEQKLFDTAINYIRKPLVTIRGIEMPYPWGGKQRQIIVDLDPKRLAAHGLSPSDVSSAVNAQNLILPGGSTKIGTQEYQVYLNSSPDRVALLNDLPIKTVNGTTIYIRDVASVRDGFSVQNSIVHVGSKRGVLLSILKTGNASTLQVVDDVKARLPQIKASLPDDVKDIKIDLLLDQSLYVRASVEGVVKEACIAAGLTALMILLFLGSWRSTIIVIISIPLSILVSIIVLGFLGETFNVMTLGGMALAVGILVDDATVAIENIHRNLHQRKRLIQAILDGSQQIAVPAFVSTLCICIVFVPVVFLTGSAKYLFTPLAMTVVFAMLTSYVLSRTLVPTMIHYLLAGEVERYGGVLDKNDPHAAHALDLKEAREHGHPVQPQEAEPSKRLGWLKSPGGRLFMLVAAALIVVSAASIYAPFVERIPRLKGLHQWALEHWQILAQFTLGFFALIAIVWLIIRFHDAFNNLFEKIRRFYGGFLAWSLEHRPTVVITFTVLVLASCLLYFVVGNDFFPTVDAGQMRLHVRCPPGTRIEETARRFAFVEDKIRQLIPKDEIATMLDNMGIPNSGINLSLSDGSLISPADGEILISLKQGHHPTAQYMRSLRQELPKAFPDESFFFGAADIVTQVLNFGLSAPIDIQIESPKLADVGANADLARRLGKEISSIPGVADVHLQQVPDTPDLRINVDRTLANELGITQRDVAGDVLISLSSSNQTAPNFWLNPQNGVNYSVFVQTPQYELNSVNALENTPIPPSNIPATAANTQLLANLAHLDRGDSPTNITHDNISSSFDVLLNVQGRDLGSTANDIQKVVERYRQKLPQGATMRIRGQAESMHTSFTGLAWGLIFAVVLVYLLMVINFQSWLDPLIILMALPGAVAGILWILWVTGTPISVPALMGAIMSIGVATANSLLLITFANDQRAEGMNAHDAALAAGLTRLRPVIMTALAMIIGMLPMSLGLGEGAEQNAPLGRAVIGGLAIATFATLFFVPVVYSLLRAKSKPTYVEPELQ
jgi:multidrug efflux pump subunit AcrB